MGQISTVEYLGDLRTKAIHLESGSEIFTDAPKDNKGKGELFAPTDLVATALASCMITIILLYNIFYSTSIFFYRTTTLPIPTTSPLYTFRYRHNDAMYTYYDTSNHVRSLFRS